MLTMMPDYETAAQKATEILIKHQISSAPIAPLPILKTMKGTLVISFTEMAEMMGMERKAFISVFGTGNQDAVTNVKKRDGKLMYIVAYNQRLPFYMLQRALARELGHIILNHDGSRPEDVRMEEALCFARHLLCPRPLIKSIEQAGIPLTVEVIGNVTGCFERCLAGMRKTPAVHVPAEMNRQLKEQFADYVSNFVDFQRDIMRDDESMLANFGTYMEGYEE